MKWGLTPFLNAMCYCKTCPLTGPFGWKITNRFTNAGHWI